MSIKKRFQPADFGDPQNAPSSPESFEPGSARDAAPGRIADAWSSGQPAPANRAAVLAQEAPTPVLSASTDLATAANAPDAFRPPSAWPIYLVALAVAGLWALAPIAFAIGYRNGVAPLRDDAFAMAVFAMLAVGPAVLVFGCAYMLRQGQKLGAEARRAKAMAEEMLAPALAAAARTGQVVQSVRDEIVRAGDAADAARETLLALREALADESERLVESTDVSIRTTRELTTTLGRERSEMDTMARSLDAQASRVSDSITQQARMVAEASDLAETQLREAEVALSGRAADIAAAAGEASSAARTAGEDLTRHIARLETAGVGVADQVRAVEAGLTDQRTALATLTQALKTDHAGFAEQAEAHSVQLSEFIGQARLSSVELSDRAIKGGESLRDLMANAAEQFRDLAETARAEREEFGQAALQSLETVSVAAARQRAEMETETRAAIEALAAAAQETRAAAASHAAAAREQVDQLSEAAFVAGQTANKVFEARLSEARALVETSSEMVDQAGATTARKLEEGAASARASLEELQDLLAQIETRAAQLPVSARGQIELVRTAVSKGMEDLTAQAHRTAEEAQAIDAAFQDRVRLNFEMLSEAVRLMGTSAAGPRGLRAPPPPLAHPPAGSGPGPIGLARERIASFAATATFAPQSEDSSDLVFEDLMEPAPVREPVPVAPAAPVTGAPIADPGLRPRLKLTPTATDAEFTAVFEAAGGLGATGASGAHGDPPEPAPDGETWTWKDLLASIDGADAEGERLQDILGAELARMGVEPDKLLPKARIDEIAAAVQTGDLEGARQVVTRLAPAATRRIARRLVTDDDVKRQTQIYVRRYQTLVDDAAVRDPEGFLMATLLGDDAGRLYLLLDAAAGDLV